MKLTTQADDLYQTIRIVQNSIPRRSSVPILKSLKLSAHEDYLSIAGTDLEIGVEIHNDLVAIADEGEIAVPADRLSSLLREFGSQDIEISTDQKILVVQSEDGTFKIVGHDPGDFPEFPEVEDGPKISISGEALSGMVRRTSFAVADQMQMYALTGIYSRWTSDSVEMVGSDGNRLSRVTESIDADLDSEITVNIPPRVLEVISKMVDDDDEITFSGDESKVEFTTSKGRLYARQVEGNYPDYEKAIPTNPDKKVVLDRDEFESGIKKVSILASREMPSVTLNIAEDQVGLSSRSQEFGEGKITVPADYSGDEIQIAFNPEYILDVLSVLEDDTVNLHLTSSSEGGIIKEGSNFLYVLMPLSQDAVEDN